jgi:hypothetical protein
VLRLLTAVNGTFRTGQPWLTMSVIEGKADLPVEHPDFSVCDPLQTSPPNSMAKVSPQVKSAH